MQHYIGLIHKDADSDFGVSFSRSSRRGDGWNLISMMRDGWLRRLWLCMSKA